MGAEGHENEERGRGKTARTFHTLLRNWNLCARPGGVERLGMVRKGMSCGKTLLLIVWGMDLTTGSDGCPEPRCILLFYEEPGTWILSVMG